MKNEIARLVEYSIKVANLTGTAEQINKAKELSSKILENFFKSQLIDNVILQKMDERLNDLGMTDNGKFEMEIDADGIGPDGTDTHAVFRGSVVVSDFQHHDPDIYEKGLHYQTIEPESTEYTLKYSGRITYCNENGCWSRNFIGENFINY